ncbi:hypothetical protein KCU77_g3825, partial [Aureobasidium melanogenum]
MFSSPVTSAILLLASTTLVDAAGYATRNPTSPICSGFDVISNGTIPLSSQNFVISTGVVCNVKESNLSTPCDVLSGGWPTLRNVVLYMNGSRVSNSYAVGYGLWNATGDFNALNINNIAAVKNQTVTFDNDTSGNVVFTPTYRCVTGRVQGCSSNVSIVDDTQVSACYPMFTDQVVSFESLPGHFENISVVAGSRSINMTSVQAAANLKQNPNDNPPYGLSSSGAGAGPRLAGAGSTCTLAFVVVWLGVWAL